MKSGTVIKKYGGQLTNFEKGEILGYTQIYWIGIKAKKIEPEVARFNKSNFNQEDQEENIGFDDEKFFL